MGGGWMGGRRGEGVSCCMGLHIYGLGGFRHVGLKCSFIGYNSKVKTNCKILIPTLFISMKKKYVSIMVSFSLLFVKIAMK